MRRQNTAISNTRSAKTYRETVLVACCKSMRGMRGCLPASSTESWCVNVSDGCVDECVVCKLKLVSLWMCLMTLSF
jgi:hypothetical protein